MLFRTLLLLSLLGPSLNAQQVSGQDLDKVLERADKLLEEAKVAYEDARGKSSVPGFVEAGFKLEDARIKYLALQEIGSPEKQKVAGDRLRAVNQLSKLIHDGKVAVNGPPAEAPGGKPAEAAPREPDVKPAAGGVPAAVDVLKRLPPPDPAKQKEAEKLVKELFKEQYAKKSPADRQALVKTLLEQATKSGDDPAALWVLYREAQDIAAQAGDIKAALAGVEATARIFDVDAMSLKNTALTTVARTAKQPSDFAALAEAMLALVNELVAADQYDAADKTVTAAVQHARRSNDSAVGNRAANRAKEVAEARTRFQGMKGVLETLAKNPDDPAANGEMGQFLCFVKGNWELGPRFLTKGPDDPLKALCQKELTLPTQSVELVALADGWAELADKEKSPLRKSQMLAHTQSLYESALPGATGLLAVKIEKRLKDFGAASSGTVNLLPLIDPKKDTVAGQWRLEGESLVCTSGQLFRLQIPYQAPEEYDLTLSVTRRSGAGSLLIGMTAKGTQFNAAFDTWNGKENYLENYDGGVPPERNATTFRSGYLFTQGQARTVVCSVRKKGVLITVDGKKAIDWEGDYKHLTINPSWKVPDARALFLGNWEAEFQFASITLTPVTGQGKRTR